MIKLLVAPVRSIVRFPLFQLAVVVAVKDGANESYRNP